jgi:triosephosphate isomerase (TIM)
MHTKYIAGNWKMNMDKAGAVALANELVAQLKGKPGKFMIAPPFVYLDAIAPVLKGSNILLGAQNVAAAESGAFTGEVSAAMLADIGVQTVILGHSERRHILGETDALINQKVQIALLHNLDVVLCVGELLEEREAGNAESVCEKQIMEALAGVESGKISHITIAYEPVWAIGTGKTATPEDAESVHKFIRSVISREYGAGAAAGMIIQYGGSMKAANAAALLAQPDIDGGLIGGASLKAETFVPICLAK